MNTTCLRMHVTHPHTFTFACARSHHATVQLCKTVVVLSTEKAVQTYSYLTFASNTHRFSITCHWQQWVSASTRD